MMQEPWHSPMSSSTVPCFSRVTLSCWLAGGTNLQCNKATASARLYLA